jgi:nucleoid-associated protein YgaU
MTTPTTAPPQVPRRLSGPAPGRRHLRDVVRGVAALVVLAGLIVGVPIALVMVAPLHLSAQVPTWSDITRAVMRPDDGTLFLTTLTLLAWAAWAAFTASALVEAVAQARGLPAVQLPLLTIPQHAAAVLVAAVAVLISPGIPNGPFLGTTSAAAATLSRTTTTLSADAQSDRSSASGTSTTALSGRSSAVTIRSSRGRPARSTEPAQEAPQAPRYPTVTVQRGDTLWGLAERHLGDGTRYVEIAHLNYGRPQPDGAALTRAHWIHPGWVLLLPADARHLPAKPETTAPAGAAKDTYIVQPGDTLSEIARVELGEADRFPDIAALNTGRPQPDGGKLTDPDLIRPGWHLRLPHEGRHTASPTAPASAPPGGQPRPTGAPAHPSPPPQPTASASVPPTGVSSASPLPTGGPASSGSSPAAGVGGATSSPPSSDDRRPSGSIQVPGGWIGLPFAAALAALGTLVWLRRRPRYVPDLATGLDEPDLPANSAVIAAARRQVQAHAPQLLLPDPDEPTTREYAQALRDRRTPPPVPPPEPGGPELAGLPAALTKQGIGLTGPGADDATRALLVATLTAAGPDDPDLGGHVITTRTVLTRLLDPSTAERAARLPRVIAEDGLDDVVARADNEVATRRILLNDADATDLTAYRADNNNEPIPPAVVITETPDADQTPLLVATAHGGHALDLTVVVLGLWPAGNTLDVGADGTTTVTTVHPDDADSLEQGARLAVLDQSATRELLDVLIEARNGQLRVDVPGSPVLVPSVVSEADSEATGPAPAIPVQVVDEPQPTRERPTVEEPADEKPPAAAVPAPGDVPAEPAPTPTGTPGAKAVVRVLGSPALLHPDGTRVDSLREAALELLVYLAVHRDGAALDDVKEALYPDAAIHRATQRLATDVANLRNRIRHILGPSGDGADPVINTGGRYHLNAYLVDVDWWTVHDLARARSTARTATNGCDSCVRRSTPTTGSWRTAPPTSGSARIRNAAVGSAWPSTSRSPRNLLTPTRPKPLSTGTPPAALTLTTRTSPSPPSTPTPATTTQTPSARPCDASAAPSTKSTSNPTTTRGL